MGCGCQGKGSGGSGGAGAGTYRVMVKGHQVYESGRQQGADAVAERYNKNDRANPIASVTAPDGTVTWPVGP